MATVSTAGCSGVLPGNDPSSAADPIEVTVENRTTSKAEIAVRVVDSEDATLFSRVFALEPETLVSRGAIEAPPSKVHAFTPSGASRTWRYAPDLPADFECEREDVGLTLHQDGTIEPWYKC